MTISHRPIRGEVVPLSVGPSYSFRPFTRTQRAVRWLFGTPFRSGAVNLVVALLLAVPLRLFGATYALVFFSAAGGFVSGWALARLHWQKFGDVPRL